MDLRTDDWPPPVQFMAVCAALAVIYSILAVIKIVVPEFEHSWLNTFIVLITLLAALYKLYSIVRKARNDERIR